jgi:hypothetical protein
MKNLKKNLLIIFYSVYLFFILGLLFHTSARPEIFGKYTYKYLLMLIMLILLFFPLLYAANKIIQKLAVNVKKNKSIKSIWKEALVVLCIIIIVISAAETYFRQKYKNYEPARIYTLDNFHPFLQYQMANDRELQINSNNFRGNEITKNKPPNTYRIFVIGGSTVFNRQLPVEKTPTAILENLLSKKLANKKIEVINAGNDGYTTEHAIIQYLFKIKDFNPDMIIMWHGINDWYYSCSPPERAYGSYKSDYSHFYSASGRMVHRYFQPQPVVSINLISLDLFLKFMADNLFSDLTNEIKRINQFPDIYTRVEKDMQYEMEYPSIDAYKRNIVSLINSTNADNVKLILGNQPFLYKENMSEEELRTIWMPAEFCPKDNKIPSLASVRKSISEFNISTEKIANENNIPFIDLEKTLPKESVNFVDDVHYTEEGSQKIGQHLFEFIISEKIIE